MAACRCRPEVADGWPRPTSPVSVCTRSNARQPNGQPIHEDNAASQAQGNTVGSSNHPNSANARPAAPTPHATCSACSCVMAAQHAAHRTATRAVHLGKAAMPGCKRRSPTDLPEKCDRRKNTCRRSHSSSHRKSAAWARCAIGRYRRVADAENRAALPCHCRRPIRSGRACSRCDSAAGRVAAVPGTVAAVVRGVLPGDGIRIRPHHCASGEYSAAFCCVIIWSQFPSSNGSRASRAARASSRQYLDAAGAACLQDVARLLGAIGADRDTPESHDARRIAIPSSIGS